MSILGRHVSLKVVAALVLTFVAAALLPVMTEEADREITLIVRGMAFYVDGEFTRPNPTITLRPGERVRFVVRNEERGMSHDFAVPSVGVATNLLQWRDAGAVTFDVPAEPGSYEYLCNPHRLMMKGALQVR
jgi:plastocyanin